MPKGYAVNPNHRPFGRRGLPSSDFGRTIPSEPRSPRRVAEPAERLGLTRRPLSVRLAYPLNGSVRALAGGHACNACLPHEIVGAGTRAHATEFDALSPSGGSVVLPRPYVASGRRSPRQYLAQLKATLGCSSASTAAPREAVLPVLAQ